MANQHKDDDLKSGDINLLPEDLRDAEERARKRAMDQGVPLQLRAPEATGPAKKRFGFLPVLGRTKWDAKTGLQSQKPLTPTAPVQQSSAAPVSPVAPAPSSTPLIQPIFEKGKITGSVSPQVDPKPRRKTVFSWGGLTLLYQDMNKPKKDPVVVPAPAVKPATPPPAAPHPQGDTVPTMSGVPQAQVSVPKPQGDIPLVAPRIIKVESMRPVVTPAAHMPKQPRRTFDIGAWFSNLFGSRRSSTITMSADHALPRPMTSSFPSSPSAATAAPKPPKPKRKKFDFFGLFNRKPKIEIHRMPTPGPRSDRVGLAPSVPAAAPKPPKPPRKKFDFFGLFRRKPKVEMHRMAPVLRPNKAEPPPPIAKPVQPAPVVVAKTVLPPQQPQPSMNPVATQTAAQPVFASYAPKSTVATFVMQPVNEPAKAVPPGGKPTPVMPSSTDAKAQKRWAAVKHLFHVPEAAATTTIEIPSGGSSVNLIPSSMTLRSWRRLIQYYAIAILLTGLFIAAIYGALTVWENQIKQRTTDIDTQITKFRSDVTAFKKFEKDISSLSTRIEIIRTLLKQHIYWTNFFVLLEKYTLPDVYYDGLTASTAGVISLQAHGTNFDTVSKQLKLLLSTDAQNEFVSKASITTADRNDSGTNGSQVTFTIELTLQPTIFNYHDDSAQ